MVARKLADADAKEIRLRPKRGVSRYELAFLYQVSVDTIRKIARNETYKEAQCHSKEKKSESLDTLKLSL